MQCVTMSKAMYLWENIPLKTIFYMRYIFQVLAVNCCSDYALLIVQRKVLNPKYGRNAESYRITFKIIKSLKVKCDYRTVCHFTNLNLCVSTCSCYQDNCKSGQCF